MAERCRTPKSEQTNALSALDSCNAEAAEADDPRAEQWGGVTIAEARR